MTFQQKHIPFASYGLQHCAPNGINMPTGRFTTTSTNIHLTRFYAPEDIDVSSINVWLIVGVSSATINLGIYDTSGATKGYKTDISVDTTLSKTKISSGSLTSKSQLKAGNVYYVAISSTSAATIFAGIPFSASGVGAIYGTSVGSYITNSVSGSVGSSSITYGTNYSTQNACPFFVLEKNN